MVMARMTKLAILTTRVAMIEFDDDEDSLNRHCDMIFQRLQHLYSTNEETKRGKFKFNVSAAW